VLVLTAKPSRSRQTTSWETVQRTRLVDHVDQDARYPFGSAGGDKEMARRRSIYARGFRHKNPIPNACRIGTLVVSGGINEVDPATGKVPAALEAQCALMFAHIREIVETAGGK